MCQWQCRPRRQTQGEHAFLHGSNKEVGVSQSVLPLQQVTTEQDWQDFQFKGARLSVHCCFMSVY